MASLKGKKNPRYKTGLCMKGQMNSLYRSWCGMKQRCLNKNNPKYPRYGGRGITVCDEWLDIIGFQRWAIKNGWKEGLSIDRIDNNKGYNPENCRWISVSENSRKKRTTKIDLLQAQEIRSRINEDWHELAKEFNCSHGNIWFIMHNFTHLPEGECVKKIKEHRANKEQL
jgi:hypothetical protein